MDLRLFYFHVAIYKESRASYRKQNERHSTVAPLFLQGGAEKFSVLAKRRGLALFKFLGGSVFFQGSGDEDFLKCPLDFFYFNA